MDSMIEENYGIYIHFPYCRRKCLYCDFYSIGETLADWDGFSSAVEREFEKACISHDCLVSLYMGGGTPSLAPADIIARLRKMVTNNVGEFTLEVNPDDVTEEKAQAWREAGVNRISMGVQSLIDEELVAVGRRHTSAQVFEAFDILRKYFSNISLDLIFGLPGQTLHTLAKTVEGFVGLRPEHISAYSLMYEECTALTRMRDTGNIRELPEEESVGMFRMLSEKLEEAGYERYEISNYAIPGFRSHHNSNYWKGVPYIGLGPSAHSYDGKEKRSYNEPDLSLYMKAYADNRKISEKDFRQKHEIVKTEILTEEELREEMIMTRLRTCEGLNYQIFEERFGERERRVLERKAQRYINSGDLIFSDDCILLSETGIMISDEIISDLF